MGTWTSQLDHKAMEEGGLVRWLRFSFTSYGLLTWRTPGNRMNYWKKLSRKQYDALRKVGSCYSCGSYFDTYHLPKHCFEEFKVLPLPSHFPDLNPVKHKQVRSMQALPCNWQDSNCVGARYHRTPSGASWTPLLDRSSKKGTNTILGGYAMPDQWM